MFVRSLALAALAAVSFSAAPTAQTDAVRAVAVPMAPPPLRVVAAPPPPPPPAYDDYGYGSSTADLSGPPTFTGTLTSQDAMRDGDTPVDTYTTTVRAGDEVTVTMNSDDFDTYLIVRQPNGREQSNDDFGSTSVSQVRFTATQAGTVTIQATAFSSSGRGDYEVRVSAVRATVVSTVSGRLDYQDMQQIKGEYFDTLTIRPPASGEFTVELVPLGFSGYLRVTGPDGQITRSDPDGYSSEQQPVRVGPLAGAPGTWTVDVTSTDGDAGVGAYDLRVIQLDRP